MDNLGRKCMAGLRSAGRSISNGFKTLLCMKASPTLESNNTTQLYGYSQELYTSPPLQNQPVKRYHKPRRSYFSSAPQGFAKLTQRSNNTPVLLLPSEEEAHRGLLSTSSSATSRSQQREYTYNPFADYDNELGRQEGDYSKDKSRISRNDNTSNVWDRDPVPVSTLAAVRYM